MNDIWSNVGSELKPTGDDWLYQKGGQIHGPVTKQAIVDKLLKGEMDVKTRVAREGGDFHPISQVAAFAPHLEEVKKLMSKRGAAKVRNALIVVVGLVLLAGAGGAYYFSMEADRKKAELDAIAQKEKERLEAEAKKRREIIDSDKPELVALVSFDEDKMTVGNNKPKRPPPRRPGSKKPPKEEAETQFMSQCQRGQGEIFGVLRKHLAKINFCVEDEKKRDKQGLLPGTLKLSFVATPTGKVKEFQILDRHYRAGPMRNCMLKAFNLIRFKPTGGTNCPVTIPIKIGG